MSLASSLQAQSFDEVRAHRTSSNDRATPPGTDVSPAKDDTVVSFKAVRRPVPNFFPPAVDDSCGPSAALPSSMANVSSWATPCPKLPRTHLAPAAGEFRTGDWVCVSTHCSYHNHAGNIQCQSCGSPKPDLLALIGNDYAAPPTFLGTTQTSSPHSGSSTTASRRLPILAGRYLSASDDQVSCSPQQLNGSESKYLRELLSRNISRSALNSLSSHAATSTEYKAGMLGPFSHLSHSQSMPRLNDAPRNVISATWISNGPADCGSNYWYGNLNNGAIGSPNSPGWQSSLPTPKQLASANLSVGRGVNPNAPDAEAGLGSGIDKRPPIINTGNFGPMCPQPGDWLCTYCNFVNWRRRKICMKCFPYAEGNEVTANLAQQQRLAAKAAAGVQPTAAEIASLTKVKAAPCLPQVSEAMGYPSSLQEVHSAVSAGVESSIGYIGRRDMPTPCSQPVTTSQNRMSLPERPGANLGDLQNQFDRRLRIATPSRSFSGHDDRLSSSAKLSQLQFPGLPPSRPVSSNSFRTLQNGADIASPHKANGLGVDSSQSSQRSLLNTAPATLSPTPAAHCARGLDSAVPPPMCFSVGSDWTPMISESSNGMQGASPSMLRDIWSSSPGRGGSCPSDSSASNGSEGTARAGRA